MFVSFASPYTLQSPLYGEKILTHFNEVIIKIHNISYLLSIIANVKAQYESIKHGTIVAEMIVGPEGLGNPTVVNVIKRRQ